MTYLNIKLNDEIYKHIFAKMNRNSFHKYQTIDEMFEDLKRVYVDLNKMQTIMNAFIRLTQIKKFAKFYVF